VKAQGLRRTLLGRRFAVLLVSVGLFAGAAPLLPAHAGPPSLSGEVLLGNNGTGPSCQTQGDTTSYSYSVSGTASGPYPGTFTESGSGSVNHSTGDVTFTMNFTINSSVGKVSGTKTSPYVFTSCTDPVGDFFAVREGTTYTANIQTTAGTFSDQGETQAEMCGSSRCHAGEGEWDLTTGQFREEYGPDVTPPAVTPPVQTFPRSKMLGTSLIPVKVKWSAGDADGIASYEMQKSSDGGTTWVDVTSPYIIKYFNLAPGSTRYKIRVRATDTAGNTSAWVAGRVFSVNALQESDPAITYGGTWKSSTVSTAYGGALRYSGVANNTATLSVPVGTSNVAWVSPQSSSRGEATVYIDGTLVGGADLDYPTEKDRVIVFSKKVSPSQAHTVQVHVLGTTDGLSTGTRVDIDAFLTTN
jgi:hypothetical protein